MFEGPTDVAWDSNGNIFVADGTGNARVAKFTRDGVFVKSWGSRGSDNGQFRTPHSVQVDADGNVYVADHGNKRVQVFDNDGTYKRAITNVGDPEARAEALKRENAARQAKGEEPRLPEENYYGWLVNDKLPELRALF